MARVCDVCGRGPMFGHRVSHAHNLTPRKFAVNLTRVHAVKDGRPTRMRVCTNCLKSGRVKKA